RALCGRHGHVRRRRLCGRPVLPEVPRRSPPRRVRLVSSRPRAHRLRLAHRALTPMGKWLRRRLIAGFFVTVPLVVSIVALVWVFRVVDGLTSGFSERLMGRYVPGLGIVVTVIVVLAVGTLATNVFGRRVLEQGEALLLHVPVFRTIYAPLKQLTEAFSPDNEFGFKRVVLVEHPAR